MAQSPGHALLTPDLARSRHSPTSIRRARVEVEVVFRFGDGGRGSGGGVHDGLCDFRDGQVFVDGEEVFDAGDEVFEVCAEGAVFEAVGEAVGDGGEAAEEFVGGGRLGGGLGGGGGHHGHAGDFADSVVLLAWQQMRQVYTRKALPLDVGQSCDISSSFN